MDVKEELERKDAGQILLPQLDVESHQAQSFKDVLSL